MNDIKYVMLPRIEEKAKEVKHQPWYKERIMQKYGNSKSKKSSNQKERILDAKQWTFVKDGLDDFRDGLPPPHDEILIKPNKGPSPNIKDSKWNFKEQVVPHSKRYTMYQRCYSKSLTMPESKRENIENIINNLAQHPLALYPHLEESVPADLYEEILEILDPEMNKIKTEVAANNSAAKVADSEISIDKEAAPTAAAATAPSTSREETQRPSSNLRNIREELQKIAETNQNMAHQAEGEEKEPTSKPHIVRNTYKWLLKKEEAKARAKARGPDLDQIKAQAIDNHIKKVTEEYCNWVKSLGGEHNIDPLTLTSLFASGYETKPPLSIPIRVVELTNIPPELRNAAFVPPDPNIEKEKQKNIYRDDEEATSPRQKVPHRYGAWYLKRDLWHYMPSNEKLIDPKTLKDIEKDEERKRNDVINAKLAPLHGTQAFIKFVKSKKSQRVPKMLDEVVEWQKNHAKTGSKLAISEEMPSVENKQANES